MENNSRYKNLKLLFILRNVAIAGQIIAILIVTKILHIPLQTTTLWLIISTIAAINIFTLWRIKTAESVKEPEFFINLLVDISALFGLLYFTGGATNPFASLFILQVIIAAIVLSPFYTWITAFVAVVFYTALMFWNVEVPYFLHHHMGDFFNLHVQGMWISFILLAGIISWFVVRMNVTIKRQDSLLAEAEKMAAIGALAANAAHELGTPLATLSLLAENYGDESDEVEKKQNSQMFQKQIARCKQILSGITMAGGVGRAEGGEAMPLNIFIWNIIEKWQARRPEANLNIQIPKELPEQKIIAETSLIQAIHNLLDNAADSSPADVGIKVICTVSVLTIYINDKGPGISQKDKGNIGTPGYTTKENGMGMGMFLAKTIISRFEGTVDIQNTKPNGAIVTINIPLARLMI